MDCHTVSGTLLWYLTSAAAADFDNRHVVAHLETNTFYSLR